MDKQHFFLSPVEVVKVTKENLEEAAEWCGGQVAETASKRVPGRQDKYVWVPTPKGSGISWAFPGMFITKRLVVNAKGEIKATWAVFKRDYFEKNYFSTPDDAVKYTWEKANRQGKKKPKQEAAEAIVKDAQNNDMTEILRKAIAEGREIHIHVGEPVVQPPLTTEEIEAMDQESRDRVNAVNEEIVRGHVNPGAVIESSSPEQIPVENIRAEDPPPAPIELAPDPTPEQVTMERVLSEGELAAIRGDEVSEEEGVKNVQEGLGAIEVFEHGHDLHETCDSRLCEIDRFLDGIHVFTDQTVSSDKGNYSTVNEG